MFSAVAKDKKWTIRTKRFEVNFAEVEDDFFSMDEYGEDESAKLLDGFINGSYRYFALEVIITGLDTGLEVGESRIGPIIWRIDVSTSHYDGLAREILEEAIDQARASIGSLQLAA